MRVLLSPDPPDSNGNPPTVPDQGASGSPPPAAALVVQGSPIEIEELRSNLEAEKAARKAREQRINELEDENRQLKTVTKPGAKVKSDWDRFFDGED